MRSTKTSSWSWSLKDLEEYDFLVCRGLKYYILTKKEVMKSERPRRRLILFKNIEEMERIIEERPGYVTEWVKKVNRDIRKYENKWKKLKGS